MVDWPGLLKWSLSVSDGTTATEFTPMTEERRKWLAEALEGLVVNDTERLKVVLNTLGTPETG